MALENPKQLKPMKPQTEAAFTAAVLKVAKLRGWRTAHFRPARLADGSWRTPVQGDGKGFPDLILIHPEYGLVVAELKRQRGAKLGPGQEEWLALFSKAKVRTFIWTPQDWLAIEAVLSGSFK